MACFQRRIAQGRRARGGIAPRSEYVFHARWPSLSPIAGFPAQNDPGPPRARRSCLLPIAGFFPMHGPWRVFPWPRAWRVFPHRAPQGRRRRGAATPPLAHSP
eukprot:6605436-Pyramimonas_sp.AAC.2